MQQRAAELTARAVNTHACDNEATGTSDHLSAVGSGGVDPQQQTRQTAMKLDSANTEIQHGHAALLPQVPLDSTAALTRGLLRTASASSFRQQQAIMDHSTDQQPSDASATIIEVAHKSTSVDEPCLPAAIKHHIPLLVIARDHWRQLLLLFLLEIFPGKYLMPAGTELLDCVILINSCQATCVVRVCRMQRVAWRLPTPYHRPCGLLNQVLCFTSF
jgi:hypothetical protein